MAVQCECTSSGSAGAAARSAGTSVRTRSGVSRPARVLEVEHVHVGARGDLARARGVVVVGVNRADAVDEADQHLLGALLLRDPGDAQIGLDVVHRLGDPDPADAAADDAGQGESHDVDAARAARP